MPLTIAPMTQGDLATAIDWAAAEGWNPGLDDAPAFLAADPQAFLMGRLDGRPVACISVVRHSPTYGFLGFYICHPDHRGQGHGWALWQAGLAHLGTRTIGLDGVTAQQENYRRSGFALSHRTLRLEGTLDGTTDPEIREATPHDLPALLALDYRATGTARPAYMTAWLTGTKTRRTLVLDRGHGPEALGTIRRCRQGCKIGPLLAPDTAQALRLLRALATLFPDRPLIVDTPEPATDWVATLGTLGFTLSFETARMYRGPAPEGQRHLIHGEGTLELG